MDMDKDKLEELFSQGKLSINSTLAGLISLGSVFAATSKLLKKNEFMDWVTQNYGKSFSRIAQKLIRCYYLFGCEKITVPQVLPDTLLALLGEEVPDQAIQQIIEDNAVEVRGKVKPLCDISRPEMAQITARTRKLEETLKGKESEIEELELELENLREKLSLAGGKSGMAELEDMKRHLKEKEMEISKLRKKNTTNKKRNLKRAIVEFRSAIEKVLISDEAESVVDISQELGQPEKELLTATVDAHEQQLRQFRKKVGIEE